VRRENEKAAGSISSGPPGWLKIDLESKHYLAPVLRNLAAVHVAVESKT
jgi:hypothetical protein